MLLRSSSTPILGSLISSSSSSSSHHHHQPTISCHFSSPISDANSDHSVAGLRRTQSVDSLASAARRTYSPQPNRETEIAEEEEGFEISPSPLFLARGLGIDRLGSGLLTAGGGGGGGNCAVTTTGNGGEQSDLEIYYKQMLEDNPHSSLILRNYAQFLAQTKGDFKRAEEYYSRAIIADPGDGEVLSQYAKLVWEQHHDEERASSYFQQAVQAAPDNSHVLAAYAGFLWETDDGDEAEDACIEITQLQDVRRNEVVT